MRRTRTPIIESIRDTAKRLHKASVMDQVTLREFDALWLPSVESLEPAEIKRTRESAHDSQAVFARLLNTRLSTAEKWEIGYMKLAGTVLRLRHLAQKRGHKVVA